MYQIKDFKPRMYQEAIFNTCANKNTLVILPTGLGKTKICILSAVHRLNTYPDSKILVLTVTKPLADQIRKEFLKSTNLKEEEVALFTGSVSPEERAKIWQTSKVVVSTPQTAANDVINNRLSLKDVSLMVLDEIHNCVGEYDYVFLCKQYNNAADFQRIIGLTASPGSELDKIREICQNAFIEDIETRTFEDEDVKPYIQKVEMDYVTLELGDALKEVKIHLDACFKNKLKKIKELGYLNSVAYTSKKQLLGMQKEMQRHIMSGEKDPLIWHALSVAAEAIKAEHALELLESQGISPLNAYFSRLFSEAEKTKVKATKNLVMDADFRMARIKSLELAEKGIDHPKAEELKKIIINELEQNKEAKIMIFAQYRDSASKIMFELNKIGGISAKIFVGQVKKGETGLTQKEQVALLKDFSEGKFNTLVATSVGEQGIDIPSVNLVVFYEPIPSAIRHIQRRGRTGRLSEGKVKILVTKNTRDEAYRWSAHHKEKKMHQHLNELKNKIKLTSKAQKSLEEFEEENALKVFADSRENNALIKELISLGIEVKTQMLTTADFIVSSRVGIERKTKEDFVNSIIDKRLLQQIGDLKNNFEKPLIIIEGEEDIYSVRNVHPNAIRGMLAAITVSYGIPIVYTKSMQDTAAFIKIIAKREQESVEKDFGVRTERKPLTTKEQQEFIIESLPNIGPTVAKSLLRKFKTIKKVVNAEKDELQEVEKVGPKKAEEIKRILEENYAE
ncbi:DEAD/DEAH box helicase [Candidatus Woesearchaeota archaeon]|nr:DEAD/DEAH box helicase [Candidatus Woesearchaeota archaeon]